ncbi:unnamed protein product [Schistosoma rodhaini]|nr:unnamed protein product [Schistosoma rodhaini]
MIINEPQENTDKLPNLPLSSLISTELTVIKNIDYINNQPFDKHEELNNIKRGKSLKLINNLQKLSIFYILLNYIINIYLIIYNKIYILFKYIKWNIFNLLLLIKLNYNKLFGLISSILIGFIIYNLLIILLNYNLYISILLTTYIMILPVFAFSSNLQCIGLLILPYLITYYIRWLLLLFATYISIFNMILNLLYNFEKLKSFLNCVTLETNQNLKKLDHSLLNIFNNSIENILNEFNSMLYNIRVILSNIQLFSLKLMKIIKNNIEWIESIQNSSCKNNTGNLYNLCQEFLNKAYITCTIELDISSKTCEYIKSNKNQICNSIIQQSTNECDHYNEIRLNHFNVTYKKNFNDEMEKIFNIIGKYNITYIMNSNGFNQLTSEMNNGMDQLKQSNSLLNYIEEMKFFISWLLLVLSLVIMIQLIIKAIIFRNSWLSKITFDNSYITSEYIQQEKQVILQGIPSTFPLTHNESKHYKMLTSFSRSHIEKNKMKCSNTLFNIWIVIIVIILLLIHVIQNSLLSLTSFISNDFIQSRTRSSQNDDTLNDGSEIFNKIPHYSIIVSGTFYANIVRNILDILIQSKDTIINSDVTVCHPILISQDFNNNIIITTLLVLTIISQLIEVYIMRLRHIIMIWYYPKISNQRASWLRARIQNDRKLFNDFKHTSGDTTEKPDRCFTNNPKIKHVLAGFSIKRITCFWCSKEIYTSKEEKPIENASQYSENVHSCSICQLDFGNICANCRTLLLLKYSQIGLEEHLNNEE